MTDIKTCKTCKAPKPLTEFYIKNKKTGNRISQCKGCHSFPDPKRPITKHGTAGSYQRGCRCDLCRDANSKARKRYREKNIERYRERQRRYDESFRRSRSEKRLEQKRRAGARYYAKRKDNPQWRNKEKARLREYMQTEKGRLLRISTKHAYLARKNAADGRATPRQLAYRWAFYGGLCWICHSPAVEFDHVKPLSVGGSNWPANLRPACRTCNARKNDSWPTISRGGPHCTDNIKVACRSCNARKGDRLLCECAWLREPGDGTLTIRIS